MRPLLSSSFSAGVLTGAGLMTLALCIVRPSEFNPWWCGAVMIASGIFVHALDVLTVRRREAKAAAGGSR